MISSKQQLQGAHAAVGGVVNGPSRSLLLVDDEATLRSALRRFFMRRGWQVCEAEDGEQARTLLLDGDVIGGRFDAVLTDMRMPRLSGIELHALIAEVCPVLASRFVFSSGDTGDEDALAFIARTGCPVIPKPFELGELLSVVERVSAGARPAH
ncbi:MAG: response regulator [Gemmatimonadaceae bacterium]|nr:response regulator [Gemmatimonadaceae bacterium]